MAVGKLIALLLRKYFTRHITISVATIPMANPTEVKRITITAASQAGSSSGGQGGWEAPRDTFKYMGVTFIVALSATVNGSAPFGPKFEVIRLKAWFAVMLGVLGGGEARRVRFAMWKVTKMYVPFSPIIWSERERETVNGQR